MPSYVTPKRATAYVTYVGLISQANTKLLQVNPTLATGDVKVSIDGGAFANLATLPVVTPAGGRGVLLALSSTEMTGDNITVVFVDAAGAEWCDLLVNIQTSVRQVDDLAWPTVTGRSIGIESSGKVTGVLLADTLTTYTGNTVQTGDTYALANGASGFSAIKTVVDALATTIGAAGAGLTATATAVWAVATRLLTAGTNIVLAKGTGVTGFTDLDAAGVRTAVGLASANLDTQLDAIPTNTDLSTALGTADDAVLAVLSTQSTTLSTIAGYIDTEVAAIKAKTDSLTFTQAGHVDANVQRINDVAITGDGSGSPFGV